MIKAPDAIATARSLLGTAYSEMDCIALIREVVKRAEGGVPNYRCQGTNWLWDSVNNAARYRHLIWRRESLSGAQAGMLAFKRRGGDVHHVGLVTGKGTVIHSSSVYGRVVETPLSAGEGWTLLGRHRYVEVSEETENTEELVTAYQMKVMLSDANSTLNVRDAPARSGTKIGGLHHGAVVTVLDACDNGWRRIAYGDSGGYVDGRFLTAVEETAAQEDMPGGMAGAAQITIIDSAGNRFRPAGDFRVLIGSLD